MPKFFGGPLGNIDQPPGFGITRPFGGGKQPAERAIDIIQDHAFARKCMLAGLVDCVFVRIKKVPVVGGIVLDKADQAMTGVVKPALRIFAFKKRLRRAARDRHAE